MDGKWWIQKEKVGGGYSPNVFMLNDVPKGCGHSPKCTEQLRHFVFYSSFFTVQYYKQTNVKYT